MKANSYEVAVKDVASKNDRQKEDFIERMKQQNDKKELDNVLADQERKLQVIKMH